MAVLDKISTLDDMKKLMAELRYLEAKHFCNFYGVFQDFSSKKLLPQFLQQRNLRNTFVSETGTAVLAKIMDSKNCCSVVFYDLETPDLNGLQFLAKLSQNPDIKHHCKVIFACPVLANDVKRKLHDMGVAAIIPKPITTDSLKEAFEKIGIGS